MEPETTLEQITTPKAVQNTAQAASDAADKGKAIVETSLPMTPQEAAHSLQDWLSELWLVAITPGWRQYQLAMLVVLIGLSYLLRLFTERHLDAWMRSREGWPKWRLRLLVLLRQRLALIWFVLLSWALYGVLRQSTWPSRSYIIGVFATMALAWLVIALLSRLVRNRSLRRIFRWTLWVYATVVALGVLDETTAFLDSISFSIGSLHISVLGVLKAVLLIAVMLVAARLGTRTTASAIRRNEDLSPSMQVLAVKAIQVTFYGIAFMVGVRALGFDLTGLALLSGAIGVGIGFGLQKVVSNLVSGIIILLDRSIKPGDVISLGETFGWIDSLGARYVSVVTRDGREYLIPNEDLITGQVVNWTHTDNYVRLEISFGTSYHNDPHLVSRVAIEATAMVRRVLRGRHAPTCVIVGFGDSSVDYLLRFWIRDPTAGLTNVRGEVYMALWDAFRENGISIPFPQREVRVLNDEVGVKLRQDGHAPDPLTPE